MHDLEYSIKSIEIRSLFVACLFHITRPHPNDRAALILPLRHYSCNAHVQYDWTARFCTRGEGRVEGWRDKKAVWGLLYAIVSEFESRREDVVRYYAKGDSQLLAYLQ